MSATLEQIVRANKHEIQQIAARHGVGNVRIFGSVARGEARADSDVDFLVEVQGPTSSWFPRG